MKRTILSLTVIITVSFFIFGCATMIAQQSIDNMQKTLDPLLGSTKNQIIINLGAPNGTQKIGDFEIFIYYRSYGYRARNSYYAPNNPYAQYATAYGNTWEAYDIARLYFQNDIFVKWDGYAQR
jgi:hypothetical protein